jgi:hypothetical protein
VRWFWIIFGVAFTIRLVTSLTTLGYIDQQYETVRVALSLAHHGTFADPFRLPTGPTAHVAPAFPAILGAVYKIFGDGMAGDTTKRILGCIVGALSYAFLPAVGRACAFRPAIGIAAGLFGAVFPLNRHEEISGNFESPWAALFLILLVYAAAANRKPLLAGAGLLFAPILAPVFLAFAIARRWWLPLALAALILAPWTWRNHRQLGAWIWSRDNLGLELDLSNRDRATPTLRDNLRSGSHRASHPSHSLREVDKVCYYGEAAYNRRRLLTALAWIDTHPARFALLTLARIRWFWFPSIYFGALVVLAVYGIWRTPSAWIFATVWLLFPLIYYAIQYDPRYRHPMEWSILLAAAKGVDDLRRRFVPRA